MKISPYLNLDRIEFVVTDRCTGRCRHCSVGDRTSHPRGQHVPQEAAVRAIRQLTEMYGITSVMTFGGEPLMYPDVTCAIHAAAAECGVAARQIITNGYFSKDEGRIREVAQRLSDAGVNDLLLSVDAFHQERIPLEPVRCFAKAVKAAGVSARLQPSWVVNADHDNPYNVRTREILAELADTGLPAHYGNDIFLAGSAAKHLAAYYPPPCLDMADRCGTMPYTEPLTCQTSLSIEPDGSVTVCSFVIGNVCREDMADILARYDPFAHAGMRAAMDGVPGLMKLAEERGIPADLSCCRSVCDLCRIVNG